jgi:hypothetical protein
MTEKTGPAEGWAKVHPLFVEIFLTDPDEDEQEEERDQRRSPKRQKRVMRSA